MKERKRERKKESERERERERTNLGKGCSGRGERMFPVENTPGSCRPTRGEDGEGCEVQIVVFVPTLQGPLGGSPSPEEADEEEAEARQKKTSTWIRSEAPRRFTAPLAEFGELRFNSLAAFHRL